MQYYYKCEDCGKSIKRYPTSNKELLLCSKCKSNRRTRSCIKCGRNFIPHSISGKRGEKALFCSTSCSSIYNLTGKKLSKETKEKISQTSWNRGGFKGCKFYKVFCPYLNKEISVQGTWELKYSHYLNEQNIKWIRSREINLRYKKNLDDILRTYYPDFYLIDKQEFIEIKGFFSYDDIIKMRLVQEQNKDKNIIVLRKDDLEKIGIFINTENSSHYGEKLQNITA